MVFDEAQRAFNAAMVAEKHKTKWKPEWVRSEPELFIQLSERVPNWSVVVGLIGSGQEIHKGEEDGLSLWRSAIESSPHAKDWVIHIPSELQTEFAGTTVPVRTTPSLHLKTAIRYNLNPIVHAFVTAVIDGKHPSEARPLADMVMKPLADRAGGARFLVTRDLSAAKTYLQEFYKGRPDCRYGIVASSKDKILESRFGVRNSFQSTKRVRLGPWYGDGPESPNSCTRLHDVVTEFGAQGLELDMALLAWGTDLIRVDGKWSSHLAGKYSKRQGVPVRDPHQLRLNAYRVLLSRGRDGTLVFLPSVSELDETHSYLLSVGFRALTG